MKRAIAITSNVKAGSSIEDQRRAQNAKLGELMSQNIAANIARIRAQQGAG